MPKKTPSYRERLGYNQAIVTLTDSLTKQRRDYWLGDFNTPVSRERYHRIVAEWEASGRRLPPPLNEPVFSTTVPTSTAIGIADISSNTPDARPSAVLPVSIPPRVATLSPPMDRVETQVSTIEEVIHAFLHWAEQNKRPLGGNIKGALRLLRQLYGSTPAIAFGPKRLRVVREAMVRGDLAAHPPRQPWTRTSINKQTKNLVKLFKWAASHELVPVTIYQTIQTVESLKFGQTAAAEAEPVRPITPQQVKAVRPFLSRPLLALIDLQLYTGARGGELFKLRKMDLDRSGTVWVFRPDAHKTAHRGKKRTIYFGPRAQEILKPLFDRDEDAYLFSPQEGAAERLAVRHQNRKTPMSCGNKPGDQVTPNPKRPPGGHYHRNSYVRAVARACEAAFPPPDDLACHRVKAKKGTRAETTAEWKERLGPKKWALLKKWRKEHRWHPHQLRHTAATNIRRDYGLEAAQLALGHSSAMITDAVYAERDMEKVIEVMRKVG